MSLVNEIISLPLRKVSLYLSSFFYPLSKIIFLLNHNLNKFFANSCREIRDRTQKKSAALPGKMLLVRIIENDKVDAFLGQVSLSNG